MKFKANRSYLVRNSGNLSQLTILIKTNTAYLVQWNAEFNKNGIEWKLIELFDKQYDIVEDITVFVKKRQYDMLENYSEPKPENIFNFQLKTCDYCNGNKVVACSSNTSGHIICPKCCGTGNILV